MTSKSAMADNALPPLLELHGVTKTYGMGDAQMHALAGIHLKLNRGEFVAVMGPSVQVKALV